MPADTVVRSVAAQIAAKFLGTVGDAIGDAVILTNAQLLALPASGIEVVTAVAAGRLLAPLGAILISDIQVSGEYGNLDPVGFPHLFLGTNDGAGLQLELVGDAPDDGITALSDLLATSGRRVAVVWAQGLVAATTSPLVGAGPALLSDAEAANLAIGMVNASGVLTGGDPDNTLTVIPIYLDIEIPVP